MPKTEIKQSFDFLVSKVIWPHFKVKGYKKSANNFRYYDNEGWGKIVNFQKSIYKDKNDISFTINTGLYLAEAEKFHCNLHSNDKFQEAMCLVRNRAGYLSNAKRDLWFELNEQTDTSFLFKTVEGLFIDYIIPYLDKINSKDDILQILIDGHKSDYPAAQIQTLYVNGYKDLAKQQLQEALRTSKNNNCYLETLKTIEQSFSK
jgi:hypothetical protein